MIARTVMIMANAHRAIQLMTTEFSTMKPSDVYLYLATTKTLLKFAQNVQQDAQIVNQLLSASTALMDISAQVRCAILLVRRDFMSKQAQTHVRIALTTATHVKVTGYVKSAIKLTSEF